MIEGSVVVKYLSYCCPVKSCADEAATWRGWLDPADVQLHLRVHHPRSVNRAPTIRRWPHAIEIYEANMSVNLGPMRGSRLP